MRYLDTDPTKVYYNVDGRILEFDSIDEFDEWERTHLYGYLFHIRGPGLIPPKHKKCRREPEFTYCW